MVYGLAEAVVSLPELSIVYFSCELKACLLILSRLTPRCPTWGVIGSSAILLSSSASTPLIWSLESGEGGIWCLESPLSDDFFNSPALQFGES